MILHFKYVSKKILTQYCHRSEAKTTKQNRHIKYYTRFEKELSQNILYQDPRAGKIAIFLLVFLHFTIQRMLWACSSLYIYEKIFTQHNLEGGFHILLCKGRVKKKLWKRGQADCFEGGWVTPSSLTETICENFGQIFPIMKW